MSQSEPQRRRFVRGPEEMLAAGVRLTDWSLRPRAGYKGPGTVAWLRAQRIALEPEPNRAFLQADGTLVAMLSWSEALVLDAAAGEGCSARLSATWSLDAATRCYSVPRRDSHYWLHLSGAAAPALFSSLCSVDLRPAAFSLHSVAQTMLAQTNAIIIRNDLDSGELAYHILGDSASAAYVWNTLSHAIKEFERAAIGQNATPVK